MTKELTKEQFNKMAFPQGMGKDVQSAKMELMPNNIGIINNNKYKITIESIEDKVILELI